MSQQPTTPPPTSSSSSTTSDIKNESESTSSEGIVPPTIRSNEENEEISDTAATTTTSSFKEESDRLINNPPPSSASDSWEESLLSTTVPTTDRKEGVTVSLNIPLTVLATTTSANQQEKRENKLTVSISSSATTTSTTAAPSSSSSSSTNKPASKPAFKLNSLNLQLSEAQIEAIKKKQAGMILAKATTKRSNSVDTDKLHQKSDELLGEITLKSEPLLEDSNNFTLSSSAAVTAASALGHSSTMMDVDVEGTHPSSTVVSSQATIPSIVKPRRPSVHFSMDTSETKTRTVGGTPTERSRQDSGGSRKHRSRKEKLVCRSESPSTDMPMASNDLPGSLIQQIKSFRSPQSTKTTPPGGRASSPSNSTTSSSAGLHSQQGEDAKRGKATPSTSSTSIIGHSKRLPKSPTTAKTREKRPKAQQKNVRRGENSRKTGSNNGISSRKSGNLKDPLIKKKKVIDIVSPKKQKSNSQSDHHPMKTSDTIFVRAANNTTKPFKTATHKRYKFSRASLYKSGEIQQGLKGHRVRRPSSASLTHSSAPKVKRLSGSPQKKPEPEADSFTLPAAFVDDLTWLLEDAAKTLGPARSSNKPLLTSDTATDEASSSATTIDSPLSSSIPQQGPSGLGMMRTLPFERRRVDSEPAGTSGFDVVVGPGSPNNSFYSVRKDLYFSPSPSYTASTGTIGGRRYSRRRHAKIHPPIENSNCNFQGHFCSNPKVLPSQYCEKHFDQRPNNPAMNQLVSQCRYVKEGRKCGNMVSSFDTMMYCEFHASQIAKAEYELRNPKLQPDAGKVIIAKISQIKDELSGKQSSILIPDVLQIVEQPEIVKELTLGSYTGGLLDDLDGEGDRNINPDKPDYEALKNAGYFTTEEIIQMNMCKLKKLKTLSQRTKDILRQFSERNYRQLKEGIEKVKQCGSGFTTNPYLINKKLDLPREYVDHQIKEYEAAKAILQSAYKADGKRGLTKLKYLQRTQELARKAKASGLKQHDNADIFDSDTDDEGNNNGEYRDRYESARYSGSKPYKCAYNEGYAGRACQNPPFYMLDYCAKHILSDPGLVQWTPCGRRIGPDTQDLCTTPGLRILDKHGCRLHKPLLLTKHKPLRKTEGELRLLVNSDDEEEEVTLENESSILADLVVDECLNMSHLEEELANLTKRGPVELTDTSDSEETDEEGLAIPSHPTTNNDDELGIPAYSLV